MVIGGNWLYFYKIKIDGESIAAARTAVVNVIVMVETAHLMSCRSLNHSVFYVGFFSNPLALIGAMTMIGAQLLFTNAPFMQHIFHTAPLDAGAWMHITGVALLSFGAIELEKWIRFGRHRGKVVPEE